MAKLFRVSFRNLGNNRLILTNTDALLEGFTNLCEKYSTFDRGGPSRLTKVLNSYIGAMVQEILTHNGDVLKFSGDGFLSMWKKSGKLSMQDVVHNAIDCGLIIQKNYGTFTTDVGVVLKGWLFDHSVVLKTLLALDLYLYLQIPRYVRNLIVRFSSICGGFLRRRAGATFFKGTEYSQSPPHGLLPGGNRVATEWRLVSYCPHFNSLYTWTIRLKSELLVWSYSLVDSVYYLNTYVYKLMRSEKFKSIITYFSKNTVNFLMQVRTYKRVIESSYSAFHFFRHPQLLEMWTFLLTVKVAISAGMSHFSIIGDEKSSSSSFVIIGQPVWDVKMAQYMSKSGDVLTAASAWMYVNEAEYWTQPCGDGRHTRVWKNYRINNKSNANNLCAIVEIDGGRSTCTHVITSFI